MCGITFAASAWLSESEVDLFRGLLYHSMDRGIDSTGVLAIQKDQKGKRGILWHKDVLSPADWLDTSGAELVLSPKDKQNVVLIGHNRWATVGAVTKGNAHPFSFSNIIGVHNGTIPAMSLKYAKDHATDSEAFLHEINENGIEAVVQGIYRNGGAFAIAYYDKPSRSLKAVRNYQRPLAMATSDGTVYGASEAEMLQWYLDRENKKHFQIEELKPYHVYSWPVEHGFKGRPEVEEIKLPAPKTFSGRPFVRSTKPTGGHYPSGAGRAGADLSMVKVWDDKRKDWTFRFPFATIMKDGKAPWETDFDFPWETGDNLPPIGVGPHIPAPPINETPEEAAIRRRQAMERYRAAHPARPANVNLATDEMANEGVVGDVPEIPRFLRRSTNGDQEAQDVIEGSTREIAVGDGTGHRPSWDTVIENDTGEDALFKNRDGHIYTGEELGQALEHPCGYCSNFFEIEDVVDEEWNIEGFVYKSDQGLAYVCEPCLKKEEARANSGRRH